MSLTNKSIPENKSHTNRVLPVFEIVILYITFILKKNSEEYVNDYYLA